VAFHPPGKPYDDDRWELYHLDRDFNEVRDLASERPRRLEKLIELWWREAEAHQVLPLDDRFGERFAENAARNLGARRVFTFHAGMGHLPTDVCPDLRSRSYVIEADVRIPNGGASGVLIAHGDATCGYALYLQDGVLIHDINVGGQHQLLRSPSAIAPGERRLAFRAKRSGPRLGDPFRCTLSIDGTEVAAQDLIYGFVNFISWSGLDIGLDRGSPVSHYQAPFKFTGLLKKVTVTIEDDQFLNAETAAQAALARE